LNSRDAKRERRRHLKQIKDEQTLSITGLDIIGSSDTRGILLCREEREWEIFDDENVLK